MTFWIKEKKNFFFNNPNNITYATFYTYNYVFIDRRGDMKLFVYERLRKNQVKNKTYAQFCFPYGFGKLCLRKKFFLGKLFRKVSPISQNILVKY